QAARSPSEVRPAVLWKSSSSLLLSGSMDQTEVTQKIGHSLMVMTDKEKPGLVPKWVASLALFSGLSFLPLTFLPYFKTGIFALNGYWSFHVAFISYGLFTFAFGPYMVKDIKRVRIPAVPGIGQAISRGQK
ncbi:hypothetical protein, partial [Actibacterium sp. D379-3]